MRLVEGVALHHTADGPTGEYPSLRIVRDGRAGLAGPLSNFGLGRSGTVYVVAAGACYHAGASRWAGFTDLNDEFLSVEAESVGTRDDWTPAQRDCYPRLVAACLYYMRRDAVRAAGHKEVCLPRGRKIDPAFWGMSELRTRVGWLLADPSERIPLRPNRAEETDMQDWHLTGKGRMVIPCPVGAASLGNRRARLLAGVAALSGPAWIRVFAQGASGGVHDWIWNESVLAPTPAPQNLVRCPVVDVKAPTTHLVVSWDLTNAADGATLALETAPGA